MTAVPEERKLVTVLFADLVGSTARASDEDPERTRVLLERFYDAMAAEIEAAGGTAEKFVGDAVMAVFGAPAAQEDHAERGLHAALAMQRGVAELLGDDGALRVGVNTGEVVVGTARAGGSFVSGDAVNVAARLEQGAAGGEILVGERTVAAVRGAFEFGDAAVIEAKGKPGGVPCRPLVRGLTLMRPRGFGGLGRVFVGRDAELASLQRTFEDSAAARQARLVTLVGDAGTGKTTLVRELWEWLASASPEPRRHVGRCLAYGHAVTYWPFAEVLREHLGLLDSDSPEAALARLGERRVLGLTLGLDVADDLHPLAARDRLQEAWVDLLEELCAERPAVVLVEDIHWAEDPLLDLVERLARDVRGPLLLVCTARPEFAERRASFGPTIVRLEPLAEADAGELVTRLLQVGAPEWVRGLVVERAEGNPFYVEELVRMLIDQGLLERESHNWRGEKPAAVVLPDSVQALVAARVDLLDPAEKSALQAAAVIGRVFWAEPVYELLEGAAPELRVLEDRDFVRRRPGSALAGDREYAFKHALTRDVAYGSLPRARRARLHAAFAGWLERKGGGRDDHAALLAHHYAEAVRPENAELAWAGREAELDLLRADAVRWLRRSGELAIGRYEIVEGIDALHRAAELEPEPAAQAEIWREIGRANALQFDGEAFWEAMLRAIELEPDEHRQGESYALLALQTSIRVGMWKRRPAPGLVDGWIERALVLTRPDSPAHIQALIARAHWHLRDDRGAAQEASALAEQLGDANLRSYAWMARATAAAGKGHWQEASEWAQRRFDLIGEITDPDHITEMLETAALPTTALFRFREARRLAGEHMELSRRLTPHHRMHGLSLLLEVEEAVGRWDAIGALEHTVVETVAANASTPCTRNARGLLLLAVSHLHAGDVAAAAEFEAAAAETGIHTPSLVAPKARLAIARGDEQTLRHVLAEWPTVDYTFSLGTLPAMFDGLALLRDRDRIEAEAASYLHPNTYVEPFALRALGIVREDETLVDRAQEIFEARGLAWHAAQTERLVLER